MCFRVVIQVDSIEMGHAIQLGPFILEGRRRISVRLIRGFYRGMYVFVSFFNLLPR